MFYEIDSNGNKLRSLHGYFDGFKNDLAGVDRNLLSDTQKNYMDIPIGNIIELSNEEHILYQSQKTIKDKRISEIKAECDLLDKQSIRPLCEGEMERVAELRDKIKILREELKGLL